MQKNETAELVCRHGMANDRCSICQLSLPHEAGVGNIDERIKAARPRLLRVARLNGIGPDGAEDVVQETFLEAWLHLEKLREPERFAAWLDGICRNVCKRHLRAQATAPHVSELPKSEGEAGALAFDLPDPLAIDPAEVLELQEMQVLLDRALGHLSARAREVIELCYLAEVPQREVAQRLDMSLGALELHLHRTRRQLHQILHGQLRDDAAAFGLLLDEDEAMGWQQARQWCWLCGKQRLRATFERQPSGLSVFRLRCPDCSPGDGGSPSYGDIVHTGKFRLVGAMRSFHLVGAMRSFRPALKRTLLDGADFSGTVFGQRRCAICESPVQIDILDRNPLDALSTAYDWLPPSIYMRVACPNCAPYVCEFSSVLLGHQCARTFLLERTRVLSTPSMMDTYAGQEAIRSRLLDLTSGERLTIMTHPHTFQVMATFLEA